MIPIVSPDAQTEIEGALLASRDPARLQAAVTAALATIGANPRIAARVGKSQVRRYIFTNFPYSIIYTATATEVRVFAFPHSSRKPGYWKNRLPKT
ncbi:hypothetical protein R5W23_003016 [Gemmata sp. JC673]|uniref:Type II toxin-antitoxin system RelE/ParE family toxin n=1 Tax=Gemmata algarum TaxID=2975278 RepID=A0ABU5EQX8_9BACT|nr:hypothetical protein [Gemmata algarum]MDY3557751.1 hypothetical protein [Gemmata algarum]